MGFFINEQHFAPVFVAPVTITLLVYTARIQWIQVVMRNSKAVRFLLRLHDGTTLKEGKEEEMQSRK